MTARNNLSSFFVKLAASFFFIGYFPFWPGAVGSLAGFVICWFAGDSLLFWFIGLTLLGLLICSPSERVFSKKDPQVFVLDEVCGMILSVLWLPRDFYLYIAAYFIFRFFDVLKPWPISKIQKNTHSLSIMGDDLAAGVVTNLILQIVTRFV